MLARVSPSYHNPITATTCNWQFAETLTRQQMLLVQITFTQQISFASITMCLAANVARINDSVDWQCFCGDKAFYVHTQSVSRRAPRLDQLTLHLQARPVLAASTSITNRHNSASRNKPLLHARKGRPPAMLHLLNLQYDIVMKHYLFIAAMTLLYRLRNNCRDGTAPFLAPPPLYIITPRVVVFYQYTP